MGDRTTLEPEATQSAPPRARRSRARERDTVRLTGNDLSLRTILPTDLPLIEKWWEEPEANWLDGGDHDGPSLEFRSIFRSRVLRGTESSWFLVETPEGPVGYVLYRTYPDDTTGAEVAMRLSKNFWGRGFGTEAFRLFVDHLFAVGFAHIWLTVYIFNPRAIRLYEKAGFREEETFVDENGLELLKMTLHRADHESRQTRVPPCQS
jgi:RimJ/RimL family protein N-acetyltransferase